MKLTKDSANGMLFGVCSGLAREVGIDATIVRVILVIAALMGFGLPIIAYIVLALIMPRG